jgi:predicted kinase
VQKPVLYLFVGYPGAGKTTAARLIQKYTGAVHLWADYERQKMFGDPTHSEDENDIFYTYLNDWTGTLLEQGKSVIFDTNFNFKSDRKHLKAIAEKNDALTQVIWINTPKGLSKKRAVLQSHDQDTRVYGNMTNTDFERIASHLEPPDESEHPVIIDGSNLDTSALLTQLHIKSK